MARDSRSTFRQQKQKRDKAKMRNKEEETGAGEDNKNIVLSGRPPAELTALAAASCPV